jgi:ribosome maturation protein SDO1
VSDKERRAELDNLFKDVSQVLVEKTINPDTGRPYTHTMLERALRDLHFNPDPKKSAKQQALEVRVGHAGFGIPLYSLAPAPP